MPVDRATIVRIAALYVPALICAVLCTTMAIPPRRKVGILLASMWNLVSLFAINLLAVHFGWWSFHAHGGLFLGVPTDLYLGWVVLWSVIPVLAFPQVHPAAVVAIMFGIDVAVMPLCNPVVQLGPNWWLGECAVLLFCLFPGLLIAHITEHNQHLKWRTVMQTITFGGIVFLLLPALIEANTNDATLTRLFSITDWTTAFLTQFVFLFTVFGFSAVQEFATRGQGTPIPFDPPTQLVTSGVYAYIANPMQFSCTWIVLLLGLLLHSRWIMGVSIVSFVYSVGIARWDEEEDLRSRFGKDWVEYRNYVRNWIPRLRPFLFPNKPFAKLYIAEGCGKCQQYQRWLEARGVIGLEILPAEDHPNTALTRMTYCPNGGTEEEYGMAAFGRALEHIHLGWAYLGMLIRLPIINQFIQLVVDASGGGPQVIPLRSSQVCSTTETK